MIVKEIRCNKWAVGVIGGKGIGVQARDTPALGLHFSRDRALAARPNILFKLRRGLPRKFFKGPVKGGLGIKPAIKGNAQQGQMFQFLGTDLFLGGSYPMHVDIVKKVLSLQAVDYLGQMIGLHPQHLGQGIQGKLLFQIRLLRLHQFAKGFLDVSRLRLVEARLTVFTFGRLHGIARGLPFGR